MTELSDAQFLGGASAHGGAELSDDQFLGSAPTAPRAKAAAPAAESSTLGDAAKSGASGVAEGIYGLAGLPGDVGRAAEYGGSWLLGKAGHALGLTDKSAAEYAQSSMAALDKARGYKTLAPNSEEIASDAAKLGVPDHAPQTTAGEYAKTIGSFLPGALAAPGESLVGNAIKYGVVPGVLSETAGQLTKGTVAEPYARTIAGLVGGFGADAAAGAGKIAAKAGRAWWEPATAAGPENIAARQLASAFHDPDLARAALEEGAAAAPAGRAIGENVPGSKPTTGQFTGDLGALSLEREVATQRPDLTHSNEAGTGLDQQNAARSAALRGIQPTGAPEEVANVARRDLEGIHADEDVKNTTAASVAQQTAAEAEAAARAQAATAEAAHTANLGRARQEAETQAGGIGTGATPEAQGEAARQTAQAARDVTKEAERKLWDAVDPDNKLALVATPISKAAAAIKKSLSDFDQPMTGMEGQVFGRASALPAVAKFRDIVALRKFTNTAMRNEFDANGASPAYHRLTSLRGAIEDAIDNAEANQAAHNTTPGARVQKLADQFQLPKPAFQGAAKEAPPLTPNFDAAAAERLKAASAATKARARTFDEGPVGGVLKKVGAADNHKTIASAVPGKLFVKGPTGAQTAKAYLDAAGPAGTARLAHIAAESFRSEVAPTGVADPRKYAAWLRSHRDALRALPSELRDRFTSAARAAQTVKELEAQKGLLVDPLQGAAESLSRQVVDENGAFKPSRFEAWRKQHADTIAQMPQDIQDKLSTAAKAAEAMGEAAARRKASIEGYQKSVAGKFLGLEHPADVTRHVAGILDSKNSVQGMSALAKRVASDPDAKEGLRKAVADTLLQRATSTQEAGASGVKALNASTFQKLVRDKSATIKAAGFSDQEIGLMRAIADDLERSQRTMSATKLPNSPGTAQDVAKFMARAQKAKEASSHGLSLLTKTLGGAYLGFEHGGIHGLLIGAGAGLTEGLSEGLLHARRNVGLAKASDLLSEAVRNPELALALLKKAPTNAGHSGERALQKALMRNAMFGVTTIDRERNHNP